MKHPRRGRGRPRGTADLVALQAYMPAEVRDALDVLILRTRRSRAMELCVAIERHLAAEGLLPNREK